MKSKERKIQTKPSQNLTKAGQGSKPIQGWQGGSSKTLTGGDEWIILVFLEHLFTKANANAIQTKPTTRLLRRTVTEESKLKTWKVLEAWPCGQVDKWYSQNVSLPNSYPITFQDGGGEGVSGRNTQPFYIFCCHHSSAVTVTVASFLFTLSLSLSSLWGRR